LLLHVAETVLRSGGLTSRGAVCCAAIERATFPPGSDAAAFFQEGKHGAALVIVEDLVKGPTPSPRSLLLHSRLALHAGEARLAAQQYVRARDADPSLADPGLEAELAPDLPKRPAPQLPKSAASSAPSGMEDMPTFFSPNRPTVGRARMTMVASPPASLPVDPSAEERHRSPSPMSAVRIR
jgi:hypothetical protein